MDRYGQRAVLIPSATLSVAAFLLLMIAAHFHWAVWTLFAFALLAAAMPSMPAMVRARWTELYRDTPKLNTAFAFESVADELVYMAGSAASGWVIDQFGAGNGFWVSVVAGATALATATLGNCQLRLPAKAMATAPATEPPLRACAL